MFIIWTLCHYHRGRAPDRSVSVSTGCLHHPLSWASHHAEFSPWLSGWKSSSRVHSKGCTSSPWAGRGSTYVGLWKCLVSCSSVPHAQRNEAVLFGWSAAAVVGSRLRVVHQHWLHGLCRESVEYVRGKCCQRQQSYLQELGSRPMFQNRRGGSVEYILSTVELW